MTREARPASPATRPVGRAVGLVVQVVAATVITLALLWLAEVVCGFFVPPAAVPEGDYVSQALRGLRMAPQLNLAPIVEDPELIWRNEPMVRKRQPVNPQALGRDDAAWTIETNRRGYRGPELGSVEKLPGVYRILCIGDSITFGFNVDQAAPYARQLELALRLQYPHRRFEVVNAGVPGWSWAQGTRFLEGEGLALRPDLVIIAHGTNDQFFRARITDKEHIGVRGAAGVAYWVRAHLGQTNLYRAVQRLAKSQPAEQTADSPGCREQIRTEGACHRVSVAQIEEHVRLAARLAAAAHGEILVLNVDFMGTNAVRGTRAAVEKDGIRFLDFVTAFGELERADAGARARHRGLEPAGLVGAGGDKPRRVLLRAFVPQPGGAMSVVVDSYLAPGFHLESPVYDDGTHGDEVAADDVYSIAFEVPANVFSLEYLMRRDGVNEFEPVPPTRSSMGKRHLKLDRDLVGPIEVLGERFLMAERTHPNLRGHSLMASAIAEELQRVPSFARFVELPAPAASR